MTKARRTSLLATLALGAAFTLPFVRSIPAAAASGITYHFGAPPIASAGSLGPGAALTFNVRVQLNGVADPGGLVYLGYFNGSHVPGDMTNVPASQCNGVSVLPYGKSGIPCNADSQGVVALTYHVPTPLPAQGHAGWIAESSPTGGTTAVDHYVYTTVYRFTSSPIAPSGSVAGGASVPVTLTAEDGLNQAVPLDTVYLSLKQAAGGGSAAVGSTALTASPARFTADATGAVHLTYTAPVSLPTSGQDAIVVQDLPSSPTETNSDSYAFAASTPVVSIGDVTIVEGDQDPTVDAQFTVSIAPIQSHSVTVKYGTLCGIGDKECAEDFRQVTVLKTVTIPANTSSAVVDVPQFAYIGGNAGETYNEGWYVELSNPSVGVLGRSVGNGMLLPDVENTHTALPYLYTGDVAMVPNADAGGVPVHFTVTLGALEKTTVTFTYATANGTALAGTDYTGTSGTGTIPAGSSSTVVTVMLMPQSPPASNRTFSLTISAASGGLTISRATGTGTVLAG